MLTLPKGETLTAAKSITTWGLGVGLCTIIDVREILASSEITERRGSRTFQCCLGSMTARCSFARVVGQHERIDEEDGCESMEADRDDASDEHVPVTNETDEYE